jgi:predicted amidohydrolase YtcJ
MLIQLANRTSYTPFRIPPVRVGIAVAVGVIQGCTGAPPPADLVIRGGVVHTMDPTRPTAEAVAVRDGRIVYIGDASGLESRSPAIAGDILEETGTIEAGKSADLVVLDADPYSIPPERLSDLRVDLTFFEGRVVYRRPPDD